MQFLFTNATMNGQLNSVLFVDVVTAHKRDRRHFCGSVVYAPLKSEKKINYYVVIDGQQRLTTIYILIKALIDKAVTDEEKKSLSLIHI